VRELRRALGRLQTSDEYLMLTDQAIVDDFDVIGPDPGVLNRRWWLAGLPRLLRRLRVDVFHGTEFAVPYIPVCASVMSVHDLSPWMDPAWHGAGVERVRSRTPILLRLGLATMVLTLSEAVRRSVIAKFHLDPARVVAVPLAASERLRRVEAPVSEEPYFLHVGTIEPRKNLNMLVDAWRAVRALHPVRLVLAGRRRADGPVFTSGDGLEVLGAVEEDKLPALYSGALAVVYPTLYEGFGLPILEAMRCGAPVITSLDESVMEVSGGAAIHCDTSAVKAWADAMQRIITDPAFREELRQRGSRRAAEFSWERTARETMAVYRTAARRFGSGLSSR
jgi:glycosyltransferase involved in cell wall biosynthesis